MAEEKIKKPNAGYFKKKIVQNTEDPTVETGAALGADSSVKEPEKIEQPEAAEKVSEMLPVNMGELVRDLMLNRYFQIMEKEARPIAEKMVKEGSASLHEVKWFLTYSERVQLAKELKKKHDLD